MAGASRKGRHERADRLSSRPVWLAIGNRDTRVDTDSCILLSRRIVQFAAMAERQPLVELHVVASPGHALHETAHEEAAVWIRDKLKPP